MTEYGIWTENDGGFTEAQLYSREAADARLAEIIAEIDDPEEVEEMRRDLSVKEVCEDHPDNAKDDCEDCYAAFDEDEEQDDEDEMDDDA